MQNIEPDTATIVVKRAIQWAMTKRFLFLFNAFTFALATILIISKLIFHTLLYSQISDNKGHSLCGISLPLDFAHCRFVIPLRAIVSIETIFWTIMTSTCLHVTSYMYFSTYHYFNNLRRITGRSTYRWFMKLIGVIGFAAIFGHLFFKNFYSSTSSAFDLKSHPEFVYSLIQSAFMSLLVFAWMRSDQLTSSLTRLETAPSPFSTRFYILLIDSIRSSTKLTLFTGTLMFATSFLLGKSKYIFAALQFLFQKSLFNFLPALNVDLLHLCQSLLNTLVNPMEKPIFYSQSTGEFLLVHVVLPFLLFLGSQLSLGLMIVTLFYPMDFSKLLDSSNQAKQLSSKELGLVLSIATDCYINSRGLTWAQTNKKLPPDASRPPLWTEIIKVQREIFDAMLNSCSNTKYGFGLPPIRSVEKMLLPSFDGIVRSLALQDFARLSRGYQHRRLRLYADNWTAVALASCATIDALTLQVISTF